MAERWHKMAVDGSIMPSMRIKIVDGEMVADGWQQRHRDVLVHKPADALKKLLAGETIYLRTTGPQLMELKRLLAGGNDGAECGTGAKRDVAA